MMKDNDAFLIGIDLGTTNLKACAFDRGDGRPLARAVCRLETRTASGGTREQDVSLLRAALFQALQDLRRELGARWRSLAGIGVAAQGGSGCVVSRRDGQVFSPLVLWNDSRARTALQEVKRLRDDAYWLELSQRFGPGMGLGRIRWLGEQFPGIFAPERIYAGAGELVFFELTGKWRQDACNALQAGCYRVLENRIDPEPLSMVGLTEEQVPPLRPGHETVPLAANAAEILGLPAGIPVAGPYMDHEAGYLSVAEISARPLQCSLGTAWVGNFLVPAGTQGYSPVQLMIPSPTCNGDRLVIQPLLTGNVSWEWGLEAFLGSGDEHIFARCEQVFAERLLPPSGLTMVPYLTQANPWHPGNEGAGVVLGISAHTTAHDLLRALALGLCCEFHRVFQRLHAGGLIDTVVLGGGAGKGSYFRSILSALFQPIPVYGVTDEDLAGARGSLYAFSRQVCSATPVPVKVPERALGEEIRSRAEDYTGRFQELFGQQPQTAPYVPGIPGSAR